MAGNTIAKVSEVIESLALLVCAALFYLYKEFKTKFKPVVYVRFFLRCVMERKRQ
jgi:hypothetical protein